MYPLVHGQLISSQIYAGKKGIFFKGVIAEDRLAGVQCLRNYLVLLLVTAKQEEYLCLEGIAGPISVKIGEKGVFFEDFEQHFAAKRLAGKARQGGLAHPNYTFNCNVMCTFGFLVHREF